MSMSSSRCSTACGARTAPCRACWSWPASPMWAAACWPVRSAWIRQWPTPCSTPTASPHTKWLSATRWEIESDPEGVCDGVIAKLGWPVFVKPANAGSSVGITKATNREQLKEAIQLALANDRKVVFEAFVDGHEVECAVIGSDPAVATRPGEILAGAEFYTYDDKYKNGVSQVVIPANLPEEKLDEVKTYAAMAYTALGCEGLARCDFFVEHGTGRVLINEINTLPGFTPISMYPKLMEHEGTPIPALIDHLIALALERTEKQHG